MSKLTIIGAAAILASTAAFSTAAQAAGCMQYDPTCATYPMPKQSDNTTGAPAATRSEARADAGRYYRHHRDRYAYGYRRPAGPGEVAGGVVGGAVGTAGAIAAGAVNTAGAIATAPFRGTDSYAYYNGPYNGGWNQQSYAERNGFVCTPGTLFKGADGRMHPCL